MDGAGPTCYKWARWSPPNRPTGNGDNGEINQGRILRLRIRDGRVERTTVVAQEISHPNGVRVRGEHLYK